MTDRIDARIAGIADIVGGGGPAATDGSRGDVVERAPSASR